MTKTGKKVVHKKAKSQTRKRLVKPHFLTKAELEALMKSVDGHLKEALDKAAPKTVERTAFPKDFTAVSEERAREQLEVNFKNQDFPKYGAATVEELKVDFKRLPIEHVAKLLKGAQLALKEMAAELTQ